MKLFEVKKISYDMYNKRHCVHFMEINGDLKFSLIVNKNEAKFIALSLEGVKTQNLIPHDIILDILSIANLKLDKVEIYRKSKEFFLYMEKKIIKEAIMHIKSVLNFFIQF